MNKSIEYNCYCHILSTRINSFMIRKWYISSDKQANHSDIVKCYISAYRVLFPKTGVNLAVVWQSRQDWSSNQQNQSKILYVKTIFDYVSLFFGLIKTISNCKSKCFTRKFNNSIIAVRKIQLGMIKSYLKIHFLQMQLFTILKNPSYQFFST